jgi:hypothetical protein
METDGPTLSFVSVTDPVAALPAASVRLAVMATEPSEAFARLKVVDQAPALQVVVPEAEPPRVMVRPPSEQLPATASAGAFEALT